MKRFIFLFLFIPICQISICQQRDSLNLRELYNMDHVVLTTTLTHIELAGQHYSDAMTQSILSIVAAGITSYLIVNEPKDFKPYVVTVSAAVTASLSISSVVNICKGNWHLKNIKRPIQ